MPAPTRRSKPAPRPGRLRLRWPGRTSAACPFDALRASHRSPTASAAAGRIATSSLPTEASAKAGRARRPRPLDTRRRHASRQRQNHRLPDGRAVGDPLRLGRRHACRFGVPCCRTLLAARRAPSGKHPGWLELRNCAAGPFRGKTPYGLRGHAPAGGSGQSISAS
jgi:hypothetical protein